MTLTSVLVFGLWLLTGAAGALVLSALARLVAAARTDTPELLRQLKRLLSAENRERAVAVARLGTDAPSPRLCLYALTLRLPERDPAMEGYSGLSAIARGRSLEDRARAALDARRDEELVEVEHTWRNILLGTGALVGAAVTYHLLAAVQLWNGMSAASAVALLAALYATALRHRIRRDLALVVEALTPHVMADVGNTDLLN